MLRPIPAAVAAGVIPVIRLLIALAVLAAGCSAPAPAVMPRPWTPPGCAAEDGCRGGNGVIVDLVWRV